MTFNYRYVSAKFNYFILFETIANFSRCWTILNNLSIKFWRKKIRKNRRTNEPKRYYSSGTFSPIFSFFFSHKRMQVGKMFFCFYWFEKAVFLFLFLFEKDDFSCSSSTHIWAVQACSRKVMTFRKSEIFLFVSHHLTLISW